MTLGDDQLVPSQLRALPLLSTAMQHVVVGHDTDAMLLVTGDTSAATAVAGTRYRAEPFGIYR